MTCGGNYLRDIDVVVAPPLLPTASSPGKRCCLCAPPVNTAPLLIDISVPRKYPPTAIPRPRHYDTSPAGDESLVPPGSRRLPRPSPAQHFRYAFPDSALRPVKIPQYLALRSAAPGPGPREQPPSATELTCRNHPLTSWRSPRRMFSLADVARVSALGDKFTANRKPFSGIPH